MLCNGMLNMFSEIYVMWYVCYKWEICELWKVMLGKCFLVYNEEELLDFWIFLKI